MIPIPAGSGFITAVNLDPAISPTLQPALTASTDSIAVLAWPWHHPVADIRCLPRVQIQPEFDHFRFGFRLSFANFVMSLIHSADSVAASVAACRPMSSYPVTELPILFCCGRAVQDPRVDVGKSQEAAPNLLQKVNQKRLRRIEYALETGTFPPAGWTPPDSKNRSTQNVAPYASFWKH